MSCPPSTPLWDWIGRFSRGSNHTYMYHDHIGLLLTVHGNPKTNVSAMIDLSGDGDDITILHNFVPKPKKVRIRRKKMKPEKASKLQ